VRCFTEGIDIFAENVCGSINSSEEVVGSAQSLIRCGYGHRSPVPQINGRFQGSFCVLVQLRVSGDKGIPGGELPQTAQDGLAYGLG
jgi:hypothetical protein